MTHYMEWKRWRMQSTGAEIPNLKRTQGTQIDIKVSVFPPTAQAGGECLQDVSRPV